MIKKDKLRKRKESQQKKLTLRKLHEKRRTGRSVEQFRDHFPQRKEQDDHLVCYKHVYGTHNQPKLTDIDKNEEKKICH